MKKHLILFLILVSVLGSRAQDWKLFQIGEKYNYRMGNMPFHSTIWIDSTAHINNDSVYYFNKVLKKVKEGNNWQVPYFYLNDQSQFFLSDLIFGPGKDLLFKETDTNKFIINPSAGLDDRWVFDSLNSITATMVSSGLENLFGEIDSVKLIVLSNNDTIIISKHHSVLKFPLFNTLNQHLVLAGIEGRNLGSQVPEFSDFLDFDPTDVFYYSYHSSMGNYGNFYTDVQEKVTVLSKTVSNDSIIYRCSYKAVGSRYDYLSIPPNRTFYSSEPDSVFIYVNSEENYLNKYPNQILNDPLNGETYKPVIVDFDTSWNTITKAYPSHNFCKNAYVASGDTIIEAAGPFGCKEENQQQVYGVHLGIIEIHYWDPDVPYGYNSISRSRSLVGYIHNGEQLGVIYNDSIFEDTSQINEHVDVLFKLYPNPVKDILLIEMDYDDNSSVFIFTSSGSLILSKAIISDKTEIDLAGLQSGIYLVKIISDKEVFTRKLIKE